MIVVDANVALYLVIEGPMTQRALDLRAADRDWAAPRLWRSEVSHALVRYVRSGAMSVDAAIARLDAAAEAIKTILEADATSVVRGAVRWGLSAYDAEYVVAARDAGVRFVTADAAILRAVPEFAVPLERFAPSDNR